MRILTIILVISLASCSIYKEQRDYCKEKSGKGCTINAALWTPIAAMGKLKKDK